MGPLDALRTRMRRRSTKQAPREHGAPAPRYTDPADNVISHEYRCVFIHVPKTGGQSIKKDIFGRVGGRHARVRHVEKPPGYFSFAFVRNPWDRLCSAFYFLNDGGTGNDLDTRLYERYLRKYSGDFEHFVEDFVKDGNVDDVLHLKPQTRFVCDHENRVAVDYLGRFETMEADYQFLRGKLGLPERRTLEQLNASRHGRYMDIYSEDMIQIVAEIYRDDISVLGYEFGE